MKPRSLILLGSCVLAALPALADMVDPALGGPRYATDEFPGFESDKDDTKPEKKEPRWLSWLNGPAKPNAAEQFALAAALEREGSLSSARRAYDALVREWPAAPEAVKAQRKVAELELKDLDLEAAFGEYRYLLDFYASQCDYLAVAREMYRIADMMRDEGKTIVFFRFDNTAEVRRDYESLVLRAPGADFVPRAMLTIAALREQEGDDTDAIRVYENLRNIHPDTPEAAEALVLEIRARMRLLARHGYNRARVRDTISFLELARRGGVSAATSAEIETDLAKAKALLADEAWKAARFYDARTRTRRSAIAAYEKFIADYPDDAHVQDARDRLAALKEEKKK